MKFIKNEYTQAALITLIFLSIFFWRTIFLGHSIVDTQIHYTDPIYRELGIRGNDYPFFRPDPFFALFDHPALIYSHNTIRSGQIPLWNPYNAGGIPFLANSHFAPLFPLRLLFYLFSPPMKIYNYYLISRLFFVGFFTYVFARMLPVSPYGATLSAISYMICGFHIAYFQYSLTPSFFTPMLFVALQKLLTRGNPQSVLLLGAAIWVVVLAGHPTTIIVIFTGLGIYFLVWSLHQFFREGSLKSPSASKIFWLNLRGFILAGILGISLSLITILPFVEFLKNGYTYKEDISHIYLTYKRLDGDGLKNLAGLFIPHYKIPWFASSPQASNTYAYQSYAGLVTLILALYALVSRPINWGLLAVLAFGSGLAFGLAPFSALNYVGPFRYTLAEFGIILVSFALAVFGGMGLDTLLKQDKNQPQFGKLIGLVGFFAINFFAGFSRQIDWMDSPWPEWKQLQYTGAILILTGLIYLGYRQQDIIKSKHLVKGLILLGTLDLFYNGYWVNFPQPEFHFPETTPIRVLKKDSSVYRVISMNGVNRLNSGLVHLLSDMQVIDVIQVRRYHEFLKTAAELAGHPYEIDPKFYDSRLWDLMNVKYLLRDLSKPIPVTEKHRLIYQDPHILIYENLQAFPRTFPVHQAILVENSTQSLEQLKDPALNLHHIVILEVPADSTLRIISGSLNSSQEDIPSTAQIVSYSPHYIRIKVHMQAPGILVLGDTYYPGWKVWVDGYPDAIFPANHLFRGVYLKEGNHEVEFRYQPISYKLGLYISLFSFCLAGGIWIMIKIS